MPVLARTINTFAAALPGAEIVAVLPEQHIGFWKNLSARFDVAEHKIVAGGAERFHSVRNGLAALTSDPGLIAVQDGVRPAGEHRDDPPCGRSRRKARGRGSGRGAGGFVPRNGRGRGGERCVAHRRPPVSAHRADPADLPRRHPAPAYEAEYRAEFTDDASVVEAIGQAVCLAEGERENLKLTTPGDFVVAEALIAAREEAENEEETTDAEHV